MRRVRQLFFHDFCTRGDFAAGKSPREPGESVPSRGKPGIQKNPVSVLPDVPFWVARVYHLLCERGFTVFAVRSGSIDKFNGLEMLDHLNRAIRYVKEQAGKYQFDPNKLGMMGASAGGHLACLAAVTADASTRVVAVGVFFPPTDFLDYGGKKLDPSGTGRIGKMVHALALGDRNGDRSSEEITQAVTAISPARLVTADAPPFLLIHGDADPAVPLQQSQAMLAALKEKGVPAELIVKPGGGHPWPTLSEEVAVLADWFVKQLVEE